MRRRWLRTLLYQTLVFGQVLAAVISAIVSASLKADPTKLKGPWALFVPSLTWTQNRAWIVLMVIALWIGIAEAIRRLTGPPWVWDAIHHQLDLFQEYAFPNQVGDMLHDHRVTLFKYVKYRFCFQKWPWSGWLVPVERSGHTTRHKVAVFRAPDDAERAEGVAGAAWASRGTVSVADLPDLAQDRSEVNICAYAQKAFVSAQWVKAYLEKGKSLALSFVGIPVEVDGKRWGVIVLDSKREMKSGPHYRSLYTLLSRMLGKLLERA